MSLASFFLPYSMSFRPLLYVHKRWRAFIHAGLWELNVFKYVVYKTTTIRAPVETTTLVDNFNSFLLFCFHFFQCKGTQRSLLSVPHGGNANPPISGTSCPDGFQPVAYWRLLGRGLHPQTPVKTSFSPSPSRRPPFPPVNQCKNKFPFGYLMGRRSQTHFSSR